MLFLLEEGACPLTSLWITQNKKRKSKALTDLPVDNHCPDAVYIVFGCWIYVDFL